jgi:hypothetical protein
MKRQSRKQAEDRVSRRGNRMENVGKKLNRQRIRKSQREKYGC